MLWPPSPTLFSDASKLVKSRTRRRRQSLRRMIDELKALDGAPCIVACIYSSTHRKATANNLERGPVHIPKGSKESIVLAKIHGPKQRKPDSYATTKAQDRRPWFFRTPGSYHYQPTGQHSYAGSGRMEGLVDDQCSVVHTFLRHHNRGVFSRIIFYSTCNSPCRSVDDAVCR
jgi:hypothetical protein